MTRKIALIILAILLVTAFLAFLLSRQSLEIFSNLKTISPYSDLTLNVDDSTEVHIKTFSGIAVNNLWLSYTDKIQKDGRTIDRSRNYLTTSEGQSYSLLRAVWMDDKAVFDRVLKWTNNNLKKRPDDKLFAWKWGQDAEGKWDVLAEEGGINTASDADQDIALALIFAYKRWNDPYYEEFAKETLNDIWRQEVITIKGKHYLLAGNWAKTEEKPTINPSYFSFAAYPIFAEVNPENPWLKLRDDMYEVLNKATFENLDYSTSVGLPPDWVNVDPATGEIIAVVHDDKTTDFSDDAFRVMWRVALDWKWHENPKAAEYLKKVAFLNTEWEQNGKIYSSYQHNGQRISDAESLSLYGGILPYFVVTSPKNAEDLYFSKIVPLYNQDTEDFRSDIGYYAQNWVWFGMAFYEDKLINLYEAIKTN